MKVALLDFGIAPDSVVQLANALAPSAEVFALFAKTISAEKQALLDCRTHCRVFNKPSRDLHPRSPAAVWKIFEAIRHISPDILHVQESRNPWFELGLIAYGPKASLPGIVTTVHDARQHPGDHPIRLHEQTRHVSIRRAGVVIVHSQQVKIDLIRRFRLPEGGVRVLPHGELGSLFARLSTRAVPAREPDTVLFFGHIARYKGLDHLVDAMPLVRSARPAARLIIAGAGSGFEEYARRAGPPCEIVPGRVPDDRVAELFQRATVLVLPYVEASQSGVAHIAAALGTPLIATAIGGFVELIHHGEDGLLVPAENTPALAAAIVQLLSDQGLGSKMAEKMRARCLADLGWGSIAKRTTAIYDEVLSGRGVEERCA